MGTESENGVILTREAANTTNRPGLLSRLRLRPELASALDPAAQPRLERLHLDLEAFYNSAVARRYFAIGAAFNETWGPDFKPHRHLHDAVPDGATVLDLGCGAAHVYRNWADRSLRCTGVD